MDGMKRSDKVTGPDGTLLPAAEVFTAAQLKHLSFWRYLHAEGLDEPLELRRSTVEAAAWTLDDVIAHADRRDGVLAVC